MSARALVGVFALGLLPFACAAEEDGAPLRGGGPRAPLAQDPGDAVPSDATPSDAVPSDAERSRLDAGHPTDASSFDAGESDATSSAALCALGEAFGLTQPVAGLSAIDSALEFAITPDEQILAWLEDVAGSIVLKLAQRSSESVAFSAPTQLTPAPPFAQPRGLALSEDGLRLLLISDDRTLLGQLTRDSRGAAFSAAADLTPFVEVEPGAGLMSGPLEGLALGQRGQLLAISRVRPTASQFSVLVSEIDAITEPLVWPLPSPRTEAALARTGSGLKVLTGVSHDGLTFFVRKESGALVAINRPDRGATFEPAYERELGAARAAIPNAPCDRLYVLEQGALGVRPQILE